MTQIQTITVKGYKSIKTLENFELRPLNILIGANGAGKSNFIGLFRFLASAIGDNFATDIEKMGGPNSLLSFGSKRTQSITIELHFRTDTDPEEIQPTCIQIEAQATQDSRLIVTRKEIQTTPCTKNKPPHQNNTIEAIFQTTDIFKQSITDKIRLLRQYHFHDTSEYAEVKLKHAINDNLLLKPDAANLAPYITMLHHKYPQEYRRIIETIRLALPFFDDFVHRPDEEYVQLEWKQLGHPDTPFKAHLLSDGSLRFICLATLLLQPIHLLPDTILIDEPELGLHPYAINILADLFKQVAEDKQLIVSTQSVDLINELAPDDVIVVDQEQGASTFRRLSPEDLADWLQDYALGELWKRNILGGRP